MLGTCWCWWYGVCKRVCRHIYFVRVSRRKTRCALQRFVSGIPASSLVLRMLAGMFVCTWSSSKSGSLLFFQLLSISTNKSRGTVWSMHENHTVTCNREEQCRYWFNEATWIHFICVCLRARTVQGQMQTERRRTIWEKKCLRYLPPVGESHAAYAVANIARNTKAVFIFKLILIVWFCCFFFVCLFVCMYVYFD